MCKNYINAYLLIFKVESPYQLAKNYNARCKYMYLWVEKSTARNVCLPTKHSTLKMVQSLTWTDPGLEQNTCMYCLVIWDKKILVPEYQTFSLTCTLGKGSGELSVN